MSLSDIYTELIAEHSRSREHKHELSGATIKERGHNPSCGDDITLELIIEDTKIKDAAFKGVGCAISQASTSMMIDLVKGKSIAEARHLTELFISMIKGKKLSEKELASLDEAAALENISQMPARVKCAVLSWHTLATVLKNE